MIGFLIIGFALAAVLFDMRFFRIPNGLTLTGCVTGLAFSAWREGLSGLKNSFIGILLPFFALLLLFFFRILGAGDIKLFCAIGAFLGRRILEIIAISFVMAAAFGALKVSVKLYRRWKKRKEGAVYDLSRMHFSVPILLATVFYTLGGV